MIRGVLIKNGKLREAEIRDDSGETELKDLYKLLDCEIVEAPTHLIGGTKYTIVCDEEGMYDFDTPISLMSKRCNQPLLVGSLFICSADFKSLTDEDIERIKQRWRHRVLWADT